MSTNQLPEPAPSAPDPEPTAVSPDTRPRPRAHRRRLVLRLIVLAAAVLAVDQATKAWALTALDEGVRHRVLGDLLGIQLLFNPGAALGLATGTTWLLTLIALAVIVVIFRVSRRLGSGAWALALGLLLGGALGNLIDRLIRDPGFGRGHVIDFIAYGNLFVGNVADIAIVAAAALLMILSFLGVRVDGGREGKADAAPEPDAADDARSGEAGSAGAGPAVGPDGDGATAMAGTAPIRDGAAAGRSPAPESDLRTQGAEPTEPGAPDSGGAADDSLGLSPWAPHPADPAPSAGQAPADEPTDADPGGDLPTDPTHGRTGEQ